MLQFQSNPQPSDSGIVYYAIGAFGWQFWVTSFPDSSFVTWRLMRAKAIYYPIRNQNVFKRKSGVRSTLWGSLVLAFPLSTAKCSFTLSLVEAS